MIGTEQPGGPSGGDRLSARRTLVRRPVLGWPLAGHYEIAFDEPITLMVPLLPAATRSNWSRLYVYHGGRVEAFDGVTGRALWTAGVRFIEQPSLLVATADHAVMATAHRVIALDVQTGHVVWSGGDRPAGLADPRADPESIPRFFGHAFQAGWLVSFRDDGGAVCAKVATGDVAWQQRLAHRPAGPPEFCGHWITYEGRSGARTVHCVIDAATGALVRAIDADATSHVLGVHATADDNVVVVASRSVRAFAIATGRLLWRRDMNANIVGATVRFDGEGLYISPDTRRIMKIDLSTGAPLWRSKPAYPDGAQGAEAVVDAGVVYALSDRSLCALDTDDGRALWRVQPDATVRYRCHFVTTSSVMSIENRAGGRVDAYAVDVAMREPRGCGRSEAGATKGRADGASLSLGRFADVRRVGVYDGALVLQTGSKLHVWTTGPGGR